MATQGMAGSVMTLRTMRRDLAILAGAAALSISFSAWVHGQTCSFGDEPEPQAVSVSGVAPAPEIPEQAQPAEPAPLNYGEHFAFVVDLEEPYIVLATDVDAAWEGEMGPLMGVDTVFRSVDVPALPRALQEIEGREFTVYAADDTGAPVALGSARVGTPRLVAQASGSLGPDATLDTWALYEQLERDGVLPRSLEDKVRAAIWADGLRLLVAPLEGMRASEATWARDAALPEPVFYRERALDGQESGPMVGAFVGATEGSNANRAHIEMGYGSVVPFLRHRGWVDLDGVLRLATTFIDSPHTETCGGFDWTYALGAQVVAGEWAPPTAISTNHTTGPSLVGDLNGDGFTDMVLEPGPLTGDTTVLRGTTTGFDEVRMLGEVPYFGCRC